jgi:TatD DNase family protein
LVDSHAHLDMEEFDPDRAAVLERAARTGLRAVLCPRELTGGRPAVAGPVGEDGRPNPPVVLAAAGVHPHEARKAGPDTYTRLEALAASREILAVGEIGLDFHYNLSPPETQREAFRVQLGLAGRAGLPVIVHSRNAGEEILGTLRGEGFARGGVLHCFTETWEIASAALDLGFFISFSGIVTFPKAGDIREVAKKVPLDRLLVETDAPFLAPVPHRGKRNEPAFVAETARLLADLRGEPLERFAAATSENFFRLFGSFE